MANTKITTNVIADNAVGITQLNVSDGSNGQALVTNGSGTLSFASVGVAGISSSADATAITIDSSERVGVICSDPTAYLEIDPAAADTAIFSIRRQDHATIPLFKIVQDSSVSQGAGHCHITSANRDMSITAGENLDKTKGLYIKTDGKTGVGTSSPLTPLHVVGANGLLLDTEGNGDGSVYFGGISGTDRSYIARSSNDVLFWNVSDGVIRFATNNAEVMRLHASGCVGVGSTSDRSLGTNIGTLVVNGSAGGGLWLSPGDSSAMTSKIYAQANGSVGDLIINNGTGVGSGGIRIQTNSTERWRIDSAGRMTNAFDALSSSFLQVAGNSVSGGVVAFYDPDVSVSTGNVILQLTFTVDEDCTNGKFAQFSDGNTNCGSISAASGTSVAFNTTSDERLKKNIVDASSQLNVIKNIKVREFDWKNNNHHDVGMIAQELNTVIPNVVIEGSDEHEMNWGVDYGKLTPYLIKAVQEQQTIIEDLKSRIETLEG